ncbi:heparinase II/III domain-containing protein [Glycocaulis sp.]|uniref:heparinase II/III domain-containing protein n=1 Tax=Glycocaulis sp. TaxID=1969725 RepID=UPI003F7257BC
MLGIREKGIRMRFSLLFSLAALAALAACTEPSPPPSATVQYATCEEPAERIIPADWAEEHLAEGSAYYEALFSPEAQQAVLDGPVVRVPRFRSGTDRQVEFIREGRIFVDRRGDLVELEHVDWSNDDHAFVATQLHGFTAVGTLFAQHEEQQDEDVEQALMRLILNWGHCAAHNRDINPRAWHEGTVMKRQSNLLHTLNYMRAHGPHDELTLTTLLYLIDAGATYLLDEPNVYSPGNHGIRQDMLLAATALSLPQHPRAGEMLELAESRLELAARRMFTEEGIWSEQAPGYVNYMVSLMNGVRRLRDRDAGFNPSRFIRNQNASRAFLVDTALPDRTIPTVGRSSQQTISPAVARGRVIERRLEELARSLTVFPGYGHAVIRGDHPDGLYLHFTASHNLPARKRHADELSVLLYNHGRMWITEGGQNSTQSSPMTYYLRSAFAHSTYTLNGGYLDEHEEFERAVGITDSSSEQSGYRIEGRSERFLEPASFTRAIIVDSDFQTVRITDTLSSEAPGEWEGRFHFPGDLSVNVEGQRVTVSDPGAARTMTVTFRSSAPLSFSTCRGERNPVCGWVQDRNDGDSVAPATTLSWSFDGDNEVMIDIAFE